MSNGVSYEEQRRRAIAIQEFVNSLPLASHSPLSYLRMVEELSHKEKIIAKLKSFVRFLSKLNPMEYINWMKNACSLYKPNSSNETHVSQELFEGEHSMMATLGLSDSPKKSGRAAKAWKRSRMRRS